MMELRMVADIADADVVETGAAKPRKPRRPRKPRQSAEPVAAPLPVALPKRQHRSRSEAAKTLGIGIILVVVAGLYGADIARTYLVANGQLVSDRSCRLHWIDELRKDELLNGGPPHALAALQLPKDRVR